MKRDLFQLISTIILWGIMWLPVWLPDNVTGNIPHKTTLYPVWDIWMGISIILMMVMAFWKLDDWMGKLYDWLTKSNNNI